RIAMARATYHMLTALGAVNRFQCIAASDREQISKQLDWPPDCWLGVNKQKWRKNFQNKIYTHVCRPNTCPTYGAKPLLFVSAKIELVGPVLTLWRAFGASARSTGAGSCLAEVAIATSARSVFPTSGEQAVV